MQFGLYCPIPMATVGSPEVAQAAAEALGPLPEGQRDRQFDMAVDLLTAADKSGFNLCLFAERHLGHDIAAWVMASAVGSRLDNIRALTAVHPGLVDPVMIAKLAASLDRIVPKRMAINIVNGWFDEEFTMFGGKVLQGEERYERAVEFIDILRGLWTQEKFTLHGKHYHIDNAQLLLKPASPTPPEIFSVSRSDRGRDFIADHCDWWFIDFPKDAETTEQVLRAIDLAVEDMNRRTQRSGRKVRYALNPFVALGTSRQDALEKAVQKILTTEKDPDPRKIQQRMLPATRAGCIGTADEVRAQIRRFADLGIELILCKMIPTVENVRLIGREVIEPLARDSRAVA